MKEKRKSEGVLIQFSRFLERLGYVDKNLDLTDEELGFFKAFVIKMDVDGIDEYIDYYKFNLERLHP
jgi:hypothetical protein